MAARAVIALVMIPTLAAAGQSVDRPVPQGADQSAAQVSPAHEEAEAVVPQMDLVDLWRQIRNKPADRQERSEPQGLMIAAAPTIGWNPTFGQTIGVAAQLAFVAGDPATTRISSSITSLSISTKNQTIFNARFALFTDGNDWLVEGDNRYYKTVQNVYGLGTNTPDSAAFGQKFNFARVHDTVYRRVHGPVYVGGGVRYDSHTDVVPQDPNAAPTSSAYVVYSQAHGLPLDSQQSGGVSANVLIDRRIGEIDSRGGWLANAFYRMSFAGFLGGDSDWQLAHLEFRQYIPLAGSPPAESRIPARHRLAIWTYADLVTGGTPPYFELPATVTDVYARSSRAYQEGRYRGERLVYGEVEYRWMVRPDGLLGMVAFANTATTTNLEAGQHLFESFAPAAGAGLRVLFNKRSRTNFCVDVAFGKAGAKGIYFALQDAF